MEMFVFPEFFNEIILTKRKKIYFTLLNCKILVCYECIVKKSSPEATSLCAIFLKLLSVLFQQVMSPQP